MTSERQTISSLFSKFLPGRTRLLRMSDLYRDKFFSLQINPNNVPQSGRIRISNFRGAAISLIVSGGNVSTFTLNNTTYRTHTFLSSGTFEINSGIVDILIVGGGGGGGNNSTTASGRGGGGGGGGEVVIFQNIPVSGAISVIVGNGGVARASGDASRFGTYIANGGGFGLSPFQALGTNVGSKNGGSGGGAIGGDVSDTEYGFSIKSNATGLGTNGKKGEVGEATFIGVGGGGGGAVGTFVNFRDGGEGFSTNMFGTNTVYGSGGGGGSSGSTTSLINGKGGTNGGNGGTRQENGFDAVPNTGSGGGGAGAAGNSQSTSNSVGGRGGSGIVIVRYAI